MYRANFKELLRIKMTPTSHGFSNIINDQSQNGLYFLFFYILVFIFLYFSLYFSTVSLQYFIYLTRLKLSLQSLIYAF